MINLNQVKKHYLVSNKIVTALDSISLLFETSGLTIITGSSGSGKSTLLNIISGTDFYTEGEYYYNDIDTSSFTDEDWQKFRNDNISFIYQDFKLIEDYSVKDNIILSYNLANNPCESVDSIIKKVGLEEFANKKVKFLSGGQKQRVAIARALAKNSPIILADEPTANLNQENSRSIALLLYEISQDRLVIVATHNEKLFEKNANRKIELCDGKTTKDISLNKAENSKQGKSSDLSIKKDSFFGLTKIKKTGFWTFFVMFLTLFITLGVFSIAIDFTGASKSKLTVSGPFINLSLDRYIITKNDNTIFSNTEIEEIAKNKGVSRIINNDILGDTALTYLYSNKDIVFDTGFRIRNIDELPEDYKGSLPSNDNEFIVGTYGGYEIATDLAKEYWVDDYYTHELTISGFCDSHDSSGTKYAYITNSLYKTLNNELLSIRSNTSLISEDSKFNDFTFYFEDTCPKNTLLTDISLLFDKEYSINFNILNYDIKSQEFKINDVTKYPSLSNYYSSRNKYIICNKDYFVDLMEKNILQLSVFSSNKINLSDKYNVIYPNAINDDSVNPQVALTLIIWFFVILLISIGLILTTYLFLRSIYKSEINNIYIRRLLGYTKKECAKYSLIRILIPELISIILFTLLYVLSHFVPIKEFSFILFSNLPIMFVIVLQLFVSVAYLLLMLRYVIKKSEPRNYEKGNK